MTSIPVNPADLVERLTKLSTFATEIGLTAQHARPEVLKAELTRMSELGKLSQSLATESALVTRGAFNEETEGLQQFARASTMFRTQAINVVEAGAGAIDSRVHGAVMNDGPAAALAAAKMLTESPAMAFQQFGTNISSLGAHSADIIDVSSTTGEIIAALTRGSGGADSVIVAGRAGSGRSTIMSAISSLMEDSHVPVSLRDTDIYMVDTSKLRGDTADPAELSRRVKDVLDSATLGDKPSIVGFDDLNQLQDSVNVGLIIRNAIEDSKGRLRVLGFTSEGHAETVMLDGNLEKYAQRVKMPLTTPDRAMDILDSKWAMIEANSGVMRDDPTMTRAVVTLTNKYIGSGRTDLAGGAIGVARGTSAMVSAEMFLKPRVILELETSIKSLTADVAKYTGRPSPLAKERLAKAEKGLSEATPELERLTKQWKAEEPLVEQRAQAINTLTKLESKGEAATSDEYVKAVKDRDAASASLAKLRGDKPGVINDRLDPQAVIRYVSKVSGVPESSIVWDDASKFANMEAELAKGLVGQEHLIQAMIGPVQRWKNGLKPPNDSVGLFFIGGPSQVGKTEIANVLEQFLNGSREGIESGKVVGGNFADESSRNVLIGAPAGFRDSEIGGQLTKWAMDHPHGVTLIDEANKMHPSLFDTLLEIGNTGQVSDGLGRMVSYRERLVIAAGNWLRDEVNLAKLDFQAIPEADRAAALKEWEAKLIAKLDEQGIKKEVFNRVSGFLVANAVNDRMVRGIAHLGMDRVVAMMAESGIEVRVMDNVFDYIAREGNNPERGGSFVNKLIKQTVDEAISQAMNRNELKADDLVTVVMKKGADGVEEIGLEITHP